MPVEQSRAQTFFQPADLTADSRLAQAQRIASMSQAARVGDRVKDSELVPSILEVPMS